MLKIWYFLKTSIFFTIVSLTCSNIGQLWWICEFRAKQCLNLSKTSCLYNKAQLIDVEFKNSVFASQNYSYWKLQSAVLARDLTFLHLNETSRPPISPPNCVLAALPIPVTWTNNETTLCFDSTSNNSPAHGCHMMVDGRFYLCSLASTGPPSSSCQRSRVMILED